VTIQRPRLFLLTRQGEVLSPQQVSGLESLVVPPLAALLGALRCRGSSSSSCSIKFGARLSTALSTAAEAEADWAAGSSSSRRGRSKQQHASEAGVLQAVLAQQQAAARRQYMLLLTGSKVRVEGGGLAGCGGATALVPVSSAGSSTTGHLTGSLVSPPPLWQAVVIHVVLHASADQAVQLAAYAQALHLQAALEHSKVRVWGCARWGFY
jgi:hypothetical protein